MQLQIVHVASGGTLHHRGKKLGITAADDKNVEGTKWTVEEGGRLALVDSSMGLHAKKGKKLTADVGLSSGKSKDQNYCFIARKEGFLIRNLESQRRLYAKGGTVGATEDAEERDQLWSLIWEVKDILPELPPFDTNVHIINVHSERRLKHEVDKLNTRNADDKEIVGTKWKLQSDGRITQPDGSTAIFAKKDKKPTEGVGMAKGASNDQKWELILSAGGFIIRNRESARRLFAQKPEAGGSLGASTDHAGARDQIWRIVPEGSDISAKPVMSAEELGAALQKKTEDMGAALQKKIDEIPWDQIADKAKSTGVSMKEAAIQMGVSAKEAAEDIPWEEIAAKAKAMGVSMKEAAQKFPWDDVAKKVKAVGEAVKKKIDEIPWDTIAEKAKETGVSMKEAAMKMGVSAKEAAEDIPWDEIAEKAKAMGVSMKEAAQKVPWAKMADKVWAVGDAVMDKMEDLADKVQEKAPSWCFCCESTVDKSSEVQVEAMISSAPVK